MKALDLSMLNRNMAGGLMCPTYKDFNRDVKPLFEEICQGIGFDPYFHKTEHYFQFPWSRGKLWVVTGENKTKGPNWAYALINELTLIDFERYREVIARVRLKHSNCPQIASCGTPEGVLSGYYDFFIEKPKPTIKVIYASTADNEENLGKDYVESLKSAYDAKALEAYLHGKFITMSGNGFYYAYDPEINEDKSIHENIDAQVHVFMDFNVSPMMATCWHIHEVDGKRHLKGFDEIIIEDGADTKLMAQALMARGFTPDRTHIYPDPAGQARSTKGQPDTVILKNAGFYNIHVRSKAPSMRKRQLAVCNLLEKGQIRYNPEKMPHMRKDFLLVEQDKVTLEKVKKNPSLTHASDGLDYGVDILFEFSGTKPISSVYKLR